MSDLTVTWPGRQKNVSNGWKMVEPVLAINSASDSQVLHAFGDKLTVLLGGEETGGQLAMLLATTEPGNGPPPHYHENEDEWFFPIEGRVEFLIDGTWQEVAVGTAVFIPRNTVHTFRNCGDEPLKMLIQTTPSGFEIFFKRCAEEFAMSDTPNMKRIIEISTEHGIHYVTE